MKKFASTLLRITIGLAISILLSEIGLRVLGLPRFYKLHTFPPQFATFEMADGETYYASMPSTKIVFEYDGNPRNYFGAKNEVSHSTNSWGFRGPEFHGPKEPNVTRIAFLGDSSTFGEGVKDGDTFAEQTALLMRQKPGAQGTTVEAYNFGVGGYNTEQEISLLKKLVLRTSPDVMVLGYNLNDAEPALFSIDPGSRELKRRPHAELVDDWRGDALPPDSFFFKPRITQLLWQASSKSRLTNDVANYYVSLYKDGVPSWEATKNALREFAEICEQRGTPCWLVIFPLPYHLDAYPFSGIHELVKSAVLHGDSAHVKVLDLVDLLKDKKDTSLWVHPTDQHPNEIVHRIVAEALADKLLTP